MIFVIKVFISAYLLLNMYNNNVWVFLSKFVYINYNFQLIHDHIKTKINIDNPQFQLEGKC